MKAIILVTLINAASSFIINTPLPQSRGNPSKLHATKNLVETEVEVARTVFESDSRPVVLYDGVCNMCNTFVNLCLDIDTEEKFRFTPLQGPTGRALLSSCGRSPDDISR